MRAFPKVLGFVLVALAAFPAVAQAGEVVLGNGDVLHGKVWKEGHSVVIDHPVLGLITLSPAHFRTAVVDDPPAPADLVALTANARPVLCDPPETIDPALTPKCKSPWNLAVGFGLSLEGGNTDKQQVNFDLEAGYAWRRRNRLSLRAFTFYEEARNVQTEGKYDATLRYDRDVSARGYVFGLWLNHRDDFADILFRTGWVAGYGHHIIKREKEFLRAEVGAGAAVENRATIPTFSTATAYAGVHYKRTFGKGDYFEGRGWVIPYLDEIDLTPRRLELRYGHPIRRHLDVTASFLLDYVPHPPAGLKSEDPKFVLGLRWRPTERD